MIRRFRFLYCIGADDGSPVKLGVCGDVFGRLSNIQAHNWQRQHIHWAVEGDEADEERMHQRFADRYVRGEFFRNDDFALSRLHPSPFLSGDAEAERLLLIRSIGGSKAYSRHPLAPRHDWWAFWLGVRLIHMPEMMRPAIEALAAERGVALPDDLFLPVRSAA